MAAARLVRDFRTPIQINDSEWKNQAADSFGVLFVCLCLASTVNIVVFAEEQPCQIHVILFTPANVTPLTDYQARVDDIVASAESFFTREFKRWRHGKSVMPFRRSSDGHVEVTALRGQKKVSEYKPVDIRTEVMDANRSQGKITDQRQVWRILVYSGSPPSVRLRRELI